MSGDDKFALLISTDYGTTWSAANILKSSDCSSVVSNTGEHVEIDLANFSGVVMFAFYGESTITNADVDMYVDNLIVSPKVMPVAFGIIQRRAQVRNMLLWNTATEANNKGFELQRSANGETFTTVAYVASKAPNGNSVSSIAYNFADERPFSGNNY